jgi:hypothetical protein
VVVSSLPADAQTQPEPTQLVKGTVVSVAGAEVRVRMASGRVDRYTVEGAAKARLKDLKPGYRVVAAIEVRGLGQASIVGFTEITPPRRPPPRVRAPARAGARRRASSSPPTSPAR